ncbi:MAG: conjugal transfer protein TraF [Desulfuromonadaceae bacterium]
MKKVLAAVALLSLSLPVAAQAVEFQTPGAVGMGGAGVARNNGALTAYWNPAGGAFNETPFAMHLGVGVGAKGSDGLAENVDRLSDIDFDNVTDFDTNNASSVGEMVKTITILDDIGKRNGNIALTGQAPLGFAIKRVSFGLFGNFEGYIQPKADITNILPTLTGSSTSVGVDDLYDAVDGQVYVPSGYFSAEQLTNLAGQFESASALTNTQALQLAYAIDNQLAGSDIPAATTYDTLTNTLIPSLATGGTNTFDKNTTSAMTKAIMYYEVPLSYGHPFDFGKYGKLGIGATAKVISGTVYQNQVLLVNRPGGDNIDSSDLIDDLTKNSKSSTNFGVDLGALYKYDKWLSVGLVAKNLNSPKFDAPEYDVPVANDPTSTTKMPGEDVKLKPQVRFGVALDPYSWLTIASDIDLTENDTVAPGTVVGSSVKSRNFGGGVEIHPYSWLRIRGGAYKNLAASDAGMVLTAGFTLFVLDVDGAFATDTFKIDDSTLPKEAKVQVSMSFAF